MDELWNISAAAHAGRFGGMDSKQLLQLAKDTTPQGRYALANAVSGFFENDELNEMEHRLVVEIMMQLIRQAELDLRLALAERLAVLPNVPPEVVIFLANDEISVARPILRQSTVLNDVDLVCIISSKSADYWRSIAEREYLSPTVVGRLIETGDAETAVSMLENPKIVLPQNSLRRMVKAALTYEKLQESMLRRPEMDKDLAADLYGCVSNRLRYEISKRFKIPSEQIETALDSLVEELCRDSRGNLHVTPAMMTLAQRYRERGELSPNQMIKTLRRGQISFFIALFSVQLGLPPDAVLHVIRKEGGKSFAIACRSIGMMKTEFASIYLLSRPARTDEKVVDQQEMAQALKFFDTVRDADVMRVRKEWARDPDAV